MLQDLTNYIYVNEAMLDGYIQQINGGQTREKNQSKKVALSITGPSVELQEDNTTRSLNTHEKINSLVNYLRKNNLLSEERPKQVYRDNSESYNFFIETTIACKVIIPRSQIELIDGMQNLAVWVSEPNKNDFSDEPYVWRGTFLYLVQSHFDVDRYDTVWSGCSALQAISNIANQRHLLRGSQTGIESLGRHNNDHPIKKLQQNGAFVTDKRTITSLYKKRYMTDEQCYMFDGEERRVNDLLAYPIFIAEVF